jgi:hypothetical protein
MQIPFRNLKVKTVWGTHKVPFLKTLDRIFITNAFQPPTSPLSSFSDPISSITSIISYAHFLSKYIPIFTSQTLGVIPRFDPLFMISNELLDFHKYR